MGWKAADAEGSIFTSNTVVNSFGAVSAQWEIE
jgi:hypothetical protein